jgi:hypothetical protein
MIKFRRYSPVRLRLVLRNEGEIYLLPQNQIQLRGVMLHMTQVVKQTITLQVSFI